MLENKRRELGEQKRKFNGSGQSSSNTRPHLPMPQGPQQQHTGMQQGQYQNQFQRTNQSQNQYQHSNQMVQRPNTPQNRQNTLSGPQMKTSAPNTLVKGCFHCGETGHYANNCPNKTTQNNSGQFNNNSQRQHQQ